MLDRKRRTYLRKTGRPQMVTGAEMELVRRKVRSFHARGMGFDQMAAQTGVCRSVISVSLHRGGMLRRNWAPLTRLTFEPGGDRCLVDGTGTIRRLSSLWYDGFSMDWLSANHPEVMSRAQIQKTMRGVTTGQVWAPTARSAEELYDKLDGVKPEDVGITPRSVKYCRTFAAKKGYAPRSCWDPDTIDDPQAIPEWTGACGTPQGIRIHHRDGIPACPPCLVTRQTGGGVVRLDPAKLLAAREARGLSLKELGAALGVHDSTIHYWETGRSAPRDPERYLVALDITPEDAM